MCDNTALIEWDSDLSSLTNGYEMFAGCTALENFTADMRSLKSIPVYASGIFTNCTSLKNVDIDLRSCTGAMSAFRSCTNLESFSGNLDSLLDGQSMFSGCVNLSSFNADIPSLTSAGGMFEQCKLNPESVNRILNSITIHDYPLLLTIGIDVSQTEINGKDSNAQLADFAVAMGYNSWSAVTAAFSAKNCNVQFQYGGTGGLIIIVPSVPSVPSVPTLEAENPNSLPIYTKLVEVENPDNAEYCSEGGEKYYNILWGHSVSMPDEYEYFGSLLEACGYYGVIPKIYLDNN